MTTVALIQARMGSTRLPGKVLMDLGGDPVLAWMVRAAREIPGVDMLVVATSEGTENAPIVDWCRSTGVACHLGPENDVLERFFGAAAAFDADVILRLTADSPLVDPVVCGQVIWLLGAQGADYASNVDPPQWPDGLDCEAFTRAALEVAREEAVSPGDREHVTPYFRNNRSRFKVVNLDCPIRGLRNRRWTLDTQEDLAWLRAVVGHLGHRPPSFVDVLRAEDAERRANNGEPCRRPERNQALRAAGTTERRRQEAPPTRSFSQSNILLKCAERLIPLGAQTFSKSRVQFPAGAAPLFVTHGDGGRTWDVDGNEYVDLVCGLLCTLLGHRDPDVDAAVREQLDRGIGFSLATEREYELAALLREMVPSLKQMRFLKNGSDATSAAVRLARAATGRDRIIICGYHGWQDWYIGATSRNAGVPKAVGELTHIMPYNDLDAAHALFSDHKGEIAALIMEPMNVAWPAEGYLDALAELVRANGALLVFDEIITGFRFAAGGAQSLFGITPDLTALGKGLGNGLPISVVGGSAEVMRHMEEVFISGTFGGEALSLAAAIAVIQKIRREPVIETLWRTGNELRVGLSEILAERQLSETVRLNGAYPWTLLGLADQAEGTAMEMKTLLVTELAARGVLSLGSHNVCYAHSERDVADTLDAYRGTMDVLAEAIAGGSVRRALRTAPLEPVFRVR